MSDSNINPGYYLPRGKYKRRKPGKRPAAAQMIINQENVIVERNRADAEKLESKSTKDEN